jgi:murein DD-endopeptidase MepM/ murein hydrolase activator NlpD
MCYKGSTMFQRSHTLLVSVALGALVAACGTQTPAPIVTGQNQGQGNARQTAPQPTAPIAMPQVRTAPAAQGEHVVRAGESVLSIARQYGVSPTELALENNLARGERLRIGQVLIVPGRENVGAYRLTQDPNIVQRAPQTIATPEPQAAPRAAAPQTVDEAADALVTVNSASQPTGPITYTTYNVQRGDTLFRIGRQYGVSPFDLMAANDLDRPQDLQAGTTLRIPQRVTAQTPGAPADTASVQQQIQIDQAAARAQGIVWPVRGGEIIQRYGPDGDGVVHTGINLAIPAGTPVLAVDGGTVIYAGDGLRTYGNLILLRHRNGLVTAYAHNSQLQVAKNQQVQKGQVIALSGQSGQVNQPQLHFEVRRNARAIDPLTILPSRN